MACGQPPPPREGGSVWQIFTLEQLKSHSWNIRLEPPTHRSVGRLSALYHRLLLQLCKLRHNSPPQDRLHRSNVTMLARAKPNIPHRQLSELFIRLPSLLCSPSKWLTITTCKAGVAYSIHPLQTVLGSLQATQDTSKTKLQARPLPHYGKIRKTEFFKWGFVFSPTL